jgi:phage gpG-like protein
MIKIKIDVSEAQRKLRSFGKALDQREALTQIGGAVLGWIDRGFATGGHGKWKRLAPNTVADKGHSRPLIRSGKLQASFKSRVFADRVTIGTAEPKAPYHEFGTKPHTMTARGRVMRFRTVDGPVAAQSVNHPGNPARPMLPDESTAKGLALDVVNKIVKAATGKA